MHSVLKSTPLLALLLLSCDGTQDGPGSGEDPFVPAEATLHRLTVSQYQATVRSLLGDTISVPTDLEADTVLHGFSSIGASELTISPRAAEQFEAAALDLSRQAVDPKRRMAILGCNPTTTADPCIGRFISTFGRRAFRRPLTQEEQTRYGQLAKSLGDSQKDPIVGVQSTIAAILQSPHFLFRVEQGEADPSHPDDQGRLRYTDYEMAARLSYLLWNTTPDDELLKAAEDGLLTKDDGLRTQAMRLLTSPKARTALLGFFAEYYNLGKLDTIAKDKAAFPSFTPQLAASMKEEVTRNIDALVLGGAEDYRDLLRSGTTYVNADLAKLYGLPAPAMGFAKVELPKNDLRGGLLGSAAILTLNAHATTTSPTHRGKFVRQYLLCQDIPPPPPGAVTSLPPSMGTPMTLRQRLEQHRKDPACKSCHERMDPIGLGLEHFDAIGQKRDKDSGLPIDASADLDGVPFVGARALGEALFAHDGIATCVARQMYRHATGHIEELTEEEAIQRLGTHFRDQSYKVRDLVLWLILDPSFRSATAPKGGK